MLTLTKNPVRSKLITTLCNTSYTFKLLGTEGGKVISLGTVAEKHNCFRGFIQTNFEFSRQDIAINAISQGANNLVLIQTSTDFLITLKKGDNITFTSDVYGSKSTQIVDVVDTKTILVNVRYIGADATGYVNYYRNYFVEGRILHKDTPTGQQDEVIELLNYNLTSPALINGDVFIDVSAVNDLNKPVILQSLGLNIDMFKEFKFQYRESWEGDRDQTWMSPTVDDVMICVHAGSDEYTTDSIFVSEQNDFLDNNSYFTVPQQKVWLGYKKHFHYLYSNINDVLDSSVTFKLKQFTLDKQLITTSDIGFINEPNGLVSVVVDFKQVANGGIIQPNAAFFQLTHTISNKTFDYDKIDYDNPDYATNI